jgi:hypothetical protein
MQVRHISNTSNQANRTQVHPVPCVLGIVEVHVQKSTLFWVCIPVRLKTKGLQLGFIHSQIRYCFGHEILSWSNNVFFYFYGMCNNCTSHIQDGTLSFAVGIHS